MKRQEFLLNLTLLVIIGALIFFIYDSKDQPSSLDELDVAPVAVSTDGSTTGTRTQSRSKRGGATADEDTSGTPSLALPGDASSKDMPPGTETDYSTTTGTEQAASDDADSEDEDDANDDSESPDDADSEDDSKLVADATPGRAGNFGQRNLFRAILTPTPTPPPPTPTPAPTPNIKTALGSWRLLSVYEGKAMLEDVIMSEKGEPGAIWEMPEGDTKQVDVGNGIMKTATLKKINNENPWMPEVIFGLEDTKAEKKIDLGTEPVTSGKKK